MLPIFRIWMVLALAPLLARHGAAQAVPLTAQNATTSVAIAKFGNKFRFRGRVNPGGQPSSDHVDRKMYDVFLVSGNYAAMRDARQTQAPADLAADHQLK